MHARISNIATAIAALLVVAAFAASPAGAAAEATIDTCIPGGLYNAQSWQEYGFSGETGSDFRLDGACHLIFGARSDAAPSKFNSSWTFPRSATSEAPFSSVSFDLWGGDGSDGGLTQTISVCAVNPLKCGASLSATSASQNTSIHYALTAANGDFPANASRLILQSHCTVIGLCSAARALEVSNLKIIVPDDVPPELSWSPYPAADALKLDGVWNSGSREMLVDAADTGSGVKSVDFLLNGLPWLHESPYCGNEYVADVVPTFCPPSDEIAHRMIFGNSTGLYPVKQGTNTAAITAYDAAGNASEPLAFNFKVDTFPPVITSINSPTQNAAGWQSTPTFDLAWTSAPENLPTATQSGVASVTYDVFPRVTGGVDPAPKTVPGVGINSVSGISFPDPGRWRVSVKTTDASGLPSATWNTVVGYDPTILAAPVIAPLTNVSLADLNAGVSLNWAAPANLADSPSGVCSYSMSVDRHPHADPGTAGGILATSLTAKLPTPLAHGTNFIHLRASNCAGVAGQIRDMQIDVDALAPEISVSSPGPAGWYSQSHPLTAWISGAAAAQLGVSVDGVASPVELTDHLTVPLLDGDHTVEFEATDSVGNVSTRVLKVHADVTPATIRFAALDPEHPALVRATVSDSLAGVREAYLQFRLASGGDWQPLGGLVQSAGGSQPSLELSALFPDADLEAGVYDLRAVAIDAADHATSDGTRLDGSPAVLRLPLRSRPSLSAAFAPIAKQRQCKKIGSKRVCKSVRKSSILGPGQTTAVAGVLRNAAGAPVGGAQLDVFETVIGKGRSKVSALVTDGSGKFTFRPAAGPSRRIGIRWAGSDLQLPVETGLDYFARPAVSLTISKRRIAGGGSVDFRGRISAPGADIPRSGKEIKFQQLVNGKWRLFPVEALTDGSGKFRAQYATGKVKRPVRFTLRAKVPGADGWAYEAGYSSPVVLVVR